MEAVTVREPGSLRIAAIGDLHCPRTSSEMLRDVFHDLASEADVLLLCGDLTDYGKPDEARLLVDQLGHTKPVPVLA
ncbi:MAG TPA: metallophosphoesterase, partial [Nitrospira sp.]|nr:metallophosphoesterase [Nitrospira sp.]